MSKTVQEKTAIQAITDKLRETPKLSLDRMPVLSNIMEQLASTTVEKLRDYCSAPVTAFVNQIEVRDSWDLLEAFEDSVAVIFYSVEWDARIMIGVERRLLFSLLETMYGGENAETPFEAKRPYTPLETKVGRIVCELAATGLEVAFEGVADITLKPEKTETALEFTTLGQTSQMMLSAQLLLQVMDHGGRMFLFIPQSALYPMRQKLERERTTTPPQADPWWAKKMRSGIAKTEIVVDGTLEVVPKTLGALTKLQLGEMLELKGGYESIVIECGDQKLFRGRLGQANGKFNITITETIDVYEELIEDILTGVGSGKGE